jgi:hypothetical protein
MALSKAISKTIPGFTGELVSKNTYFKVASFTGNKSLLSVTVIGISDGTQVYTQGHSFELNLEGPNPIKQAYLHLKTLPEFADAIDC